MAPSRGESEAEYTIAAVSKLTGISCHALRVWERRYGFPVPQRSASGHRRYSRAQVQTLCRVAELSHQGRAIGDLIVDLRAGLFVDEAAPDLGADTSPEPLAAEVVTALLSGNLGAADVAYEDLARRLSPAELIARVLEPAFVEVGERWFRGECAVYQEHCATGFLRQKAEILIEQARRSNARPVRTILIGAVQGDRHAGGVLLLNLVLERAGWRVLSLGVDLPVSEFQKAATAWKPDALGLSFVLSRNINKRFQELSKIRGLPIFVGGRSILNYQGLARRHGLIPLPGPITTAVAELAAEFKV